MSQKSWQLRSVQTGWKHFSSFLSSLAISLLLFLSFVLLGTVHCFSFSVMFSSTHFILSRCRFISHGYADNNGAWMRTMMARTIYQWEKMFLRLIVWNSCGCKNSRLMVSCFFLACLLLVLCCRARIAYVNVHYASPLRGVNRRRMSMHSSFPPRPHLGSF